jgi:hypothetical protein
LYRPPRRFPGVVGGARTKRALEVDNPGVATYLLGTLGVSEEIGVVPVLPDEDQMRRGHELGDESAARGRAGKRFGRNAKPAAVILFAVIGPELFLLDRLVEENGSGRAALGLELHESA